ncbi:universal stress protein [Chitinophaga sp. XS-30]|uniref:universal stress protein n=1 Tax=Chitinophaga sp. XS-30 TaxID=2604421 RepID=UPI0011DDFB27|nr:universal stress protein [Chitinophaga sp. XS-30]QEH42274.1 universal stress protein [Chitinophaga sp. XS-30]
MKTILVPTDFSTCANNATNFAVQSAKYFPAEIVLLHAIDADGGLYTDYMGVNREFSESLMEEAGEHLSQVKKAILETEGIAVKTTLFRGSVHEAILKTAADIDADITIMGTYGTSSFGDKLWGSKTAAIIGKSKIPVMVVPFGYEWKKPENIMMATTRFEREPAVLDFLFELADQYKAGVRVAVFTDEDDDKAGTFLEHRFNMEHYGSMLSETYEAQQITAVNLYGPEFEEGIQRYIDENGIDMLVMITYQRSFWDRIFHPSKTKRMSYQTKVPLLAIPAK